MKAKLITSFYLFGLAHHLFTYYYSTVELDFTKTTRPAVLDIQRFTNRYLTSWNMGLQTIYFALALTLEILLFNKDNVTGQTIEKIGKIRGYLFSAFVLPSTVVVAFFFWFFYYLKREFVMPVGVEEVFPDWINHSCHTNIILLPIIELTLQNIYIPSIWTSLIGLTIYSHIYNSLYLFTYFETGKWMYPIYNELSWPQRIFLMETMFAMGAFICVIGYFIQKLKSKSDITKADFKTRALNVAKKLL